jgi:hypothetical protein
MGGEVAVDRAELGQARGHQRVVLCLLGGDSNPIVVEFTRQHLPGEAGDDVPGEVDGVELDMRQRVEQRDAARRRAAGATPRHVPRRQQQRQRRPCRAVGRRAVADLGDGAALPRGRGGTAERNLLGRRGGGEDGARGLRQGIGPRRQSAFTAVSTASTWPGTLTLCQTPRTTPFSSMRKVARSIPMYFRPYMLFSTQTP